MAQDAESVLQIFNIVGVKFPLRLLNSTKVPPECDPTIFKSMALHILCTYASVSELACHTDLLQILPRFLSLLTEFAHISEYPHFIHDVLQYLSAVSCTAEGRALLLRDGVTTFADIISVGHEKVISKIIPIMMYLLSSEIQYNILCSSSTILHLIRKLTACFYTRQDALKFELCEVLVVFLESISLLPPSSMARKVLEPSSEIDVSLNAFLPPSSTVSMNADWVVNIALTIQQLIQNKLGPVFRNKVLRLCALLTELFGVQWMLRYLSFLSFF